LHNPPADDDLESIVIGAGILGTGGGNLYLGNIRS
jgi:DUF917 family protein